MKTNATKPVEKAIVGNEPAEQSLFETDTQTDTAPKPRGRRKKATDTGE